MDTLRDYTELARLAACGDSEALAELVERIRPALFHKAYTSLGNFADAQDTVASTVLQIVRHIHNLQQPEYIRGWIYSILTNEINMCFRRVRTVSLSDDMPDDKNTYIQEIEADVREALNRIPYNNARAVALHYIAGISVEEVSQRLKRPVGTIKRWLHFGRKYLAAELGEYAMSEQNTRAVLFSSRMDKQMVDDISAALKDAGYSSVTVLNNMPCLAKTGNKDSLEFHLPDVLKDVNFVLIDELVDNRSAFELHTILKAAVESADMAFGILLDSPTSENTIFAAWAAGFDLCLTRDGLNMQELSRLASVICKR